MTKLPVVAATAALVAMASVSTWVLAAESRGELPAGDFTPRKLTTLMLDGPAAATARRNLLRRAAVRVDDAREPAPLPGYLECRYLKDEPSGTTAKFDCVLDGGDVVKVKYNRNSEIHAEVAATRLVHALGFAADRMDIVRRLRCFGCPRYPFFAMQLLSLASASNALGDRGLGDGFTDFEWVAVERKFPAAAIETPEVQGWTWFELQQSTAPRADVDAFRLLAVFLAHWDNKSENQRLVCLDRPAEAASPRAAGSGSGETGACGRPLAMIQDLGATFGPTKVNLARWQSLPIWENRAACAVTMRHLPWRGATFVPVTISEEGRQLLLRELTALTDADVRALFAEARFPAFQASTDDERDLAAWTRAFRSRVEQIAGGGPCPTRA